jgi:hypothetical protein
MGFLHTNFQAFVSEKARACIKVGNIIRPQQISGLVGIGQELLYKLHRPNRFFLAS